LAAYEREKAPAHDPTELTYDVKVRLSEGVVRPQNKAAPAECWPAM
jgi:hypothetical protein